MHLHLAFGIPSGPEWLIILVIALLIFGSRLPSVMRSLGQSVNEFKRGLNDAIDEEEPKPEGEDDEDDKSNKGDEKEKTLA